MSSFLKVFWGICLVMVFCGSVPVRVVAGESETAAASPEAAAAMACPYPYTFFDPARPKITEKKMVVAPGAYGFGYPGFLWGGWVMGGCGGWYPSGYLCGYNSWGWYGCQPIVPCGGYGVWPSGLTINIRF